MSVCGQPDEESVSEEPVPGLPLRERELRTKSASKAVRVLTVLAYLLSVSLAAILLSVYYMCVWDSTPRNSTEPVATAQRDHHSGHHRHRTDIDHHFHYQYLTNERIQLEYAIEGGSSTSIGDNETGSMSSTDTYSDTTQPSIEPEPSPGDTNATTPIT